MCAATQDLATNAIDVTSSDAKTRIAAALLALSKVPDWPAGDEARDAAITWYQAMSTAVEINATDQLGAIQYQIDYFDELGTIGHSLDALQEATGEDLPCREPPVPTAS